MKIWKDQLQPVYHQTWDRMTRDHQANYMWHTAYVSPSQILWTQDRDRLYSEAPKTPKLLFTFRYFEFEPLLLSAN